MQARPIRMSLIGRVHDPDVQVVLVIDNLSHRKDHIGQQLMTPHQFIEILLVVVNIRKEMVLLVLPRDLVEDHYLVLRLVQSHPIDVTLAFRE